MTADYCPFDHAFLGRVANRIINEVRGINRVTYYSRRSRPARCTKERLSEASRSALVVYALSRFLIDVDVASLQLGHALLDHCIGLSFVAEFLDGGIENS